MFDRTHHGPNLTYWSSDDHDHTSDRTQSLVIQSVIAVPLNVFAYNLLTTAYS